MSNGRFVALRECANFLGGSTPSRNNDAFFSNGNIYWVKTTDLNNGRVFDTEEKITPLAINQTSCKIVPKGAVLVAMYGGFNQIGRTGLMEFDGAINQALTAVITDKKKLIPEYLLYWLNFKVKFWKTFAGSSRKDPNITKKDIMGFPVYIVPIEIQLEIINLLSTWDQAIEKTERLIAAKGKRFLWLSGRYLFGGNRPNTKASKKTKWFSVPDHWEIVKIGSIAKEVTETNEAGENIPVLSCTKYDGLVDSLTYFDKQVFSMDTSNYKVVSRGQFAYATNHIEEGSIGYQNLYSKGLVSPMYTVFKTDTIIDDSYLYKVLKTETYKHIFRVSTSASVDRRGSLRWKEFAKLPIPLPPADEQHKISRDLDTVQKEIDLLKKLLEAYRKQKRGLMQKLLTGKQHVITIEEKDG